MFQSLSNTDDNVLVCAPAGSGKTLCGELALMRMLSIPSDKEPSAVYIAPKQDTVNNVYKVCVTAALYSQHTTAGLGEEVLNRESGETDWRAGD